MSVQFEEDSTMSTYDPNEEVTGLQGLLISWKIAKTKSQANIVLIIILILLLIGLGLSMMNWKNGQSSKISAPPGNQLIKRSGSPPRLLTPIK